MENTAQLRDAILALNDPVADHLLTLGVLRVGHFVHPDGITHSDLWFEQGLLFWQRSALHDLTEHLTSTIRPILVGASTDFVIVGADAASANLAGEMARHLNLRFTWPESLVPPFFAAPIAEYLRRRPTVVIDTDFGGNGDRTLAAVDAVRSVGGQVRAVAALVDWSVGHQASERFGVQEPSVFSLAEVPATYWSTAVPVLKGGLTGVAPPPLAAGPVRPCLLCQQEVAISPTLGRRPELVH